MNNPFGMRFSGTEIKDRIEEIIDEISDFGDVAEGGEFEGQIADLKEELDLLRELDQDEQYVHEKDFQKFAQELADDLAPRDIRNQWPYTCIDWERAADDLKTDYTVVEIGGDTYYYRS